MRSDFSGESHDVDVGVFALRTFRINFERQELLAVTQRGHFWLNGVCRATCTNGLAHKSPHEKCDCGIYGCFTLDKLAEYGAGPMQVLVAVIAAQGKTIIGDYGLRTEAARVVAYWSSSWRIRKICESECEDVKRYRYLGNMLKDYGMQRQLPVKPDLPWHVRLVRSLTWTTFWLVWGIFFLASDAIGMVVEFSQHAWAAAGFDTLGVIFMAFFVSLLLRSFRGRIGI